MRTILALALAASATAHAADDLHVHPLTASASAAVAARIDAQLDQPVTVDFKDTSLDDVLQYLQQVTNVSMTIDPEIIAAAPPPLTLKAVHTRLRTVLDRALQPSGLRWNIRDGAIRVTTANDPESATAPASKP